MNLAEQTKGILDILGSGFPLHRLELILQHKEVILRWLNSKEFKDQCANHPYPPLLNPKEIIYQQTDPQVAWDFNIPLPPSYEITFCITAGAGGSAFVKVLSLCDVSCHGSWYGHIIAYLENYKILCQSPSYKALIVTDFKGQETEKFWSLVTKRVPLLCLVRDLILGIRHLVNHTRPIEQKPLVKRFNLSCDVAEIMPEVAYHCSGGKPNCEAVIEDCISGLYRTIFCLPQKIKALSPTQVHYIDSQEINAENAFETFTQLAKKFGFHPPKAEDKEVFKQRINKNTSLVTAFPVVLFAHSSDIGKRNDYSSLQTPAGEGANIVITTQAGFSKQDVNLTKELMPHEIYNPSIVISANKQDAEILNAQPKLKKAVQKFLKDYFDEFKKREDEIAKNLVSSEEILAYFKTHKQQYNAMSAVFNEEIAHLKKHCPEIVKSWSYYQEFLKIKF